MSWLHSFPLSSSYFLPTIMPFHPHFAANTTNTFTSATSNATTLPLLERYLYYLFSNNIKTTANTYTSHITTITKTYTVIATTTTNAHIFLQELFSTTHATSFFPSFFRPLLRHTGYTGVMDRTLPYGTARGKCLCIDCHTRCNGRE